ncbi:13788_t:CDS:2, partial [Dentiscutata heterogama]
IPDIFNDTNFSPPFNNEDSDSTININPCLSYSNQIDDDIVVNTDLPMFTEHNHEDTSSLSLFENDNNPSNIDASSYQHTLHRGFEYQVFRNDKDSNNPSITRRKSFHYSSSGTYESRKAINQNSHRIRGTTKMNCKWYCTFTLSKTAHQVKCTTLKDKHNHEVISAQVFDIIARYRRLSEEMIQDIKFFLDCKVAPMTQLEMLKKKYPQHVFHKQDVYNTIYKLRKDNDERLDSVSFLDILFEKMAQDPCWKVFIRHSGSERRLSGVFWMSPSQQELYQHFSDIVLNDNTCKTNKYNMYLSVFMIKDNYGKFRNVANALVEDELSSTYVWILQCLKKATDNIVSKSFWTDAEPGLINAVSQVQTSTSLVRLSIRVEFIIKTFPEYERYMSKKLYANRSSWARAYTPFQFNAGIQSTQSIESFNNIIKKSLNSASTLCKLEEAIDKRHEQEIRYCKLVDIKVQYITVGLPYISSQFFSAVDNVLVNFLTPLILSLQRFQISQSFTYEGQREHMISENLCLDTIDDNFIEDVVDEPQATLKAILDQVLENSLSLTAIESSIDTTIQVNLNLQSLRNFQGSNYGTSVQKITSQRNRFGVAFLTAKIAINVALETRSDNELFQILKDFISAKHLIGQTNDPHVTKIRGAPSKKKIKRMIEMPKKNVRQEITNQINNTQKNCADETGLRPQRKC